MLRDYQEKVIAHLQHDKSDRICVQLATGAGKTFIFAHVAAHEDNKVLILVNRIELLQQTVNTLKEGYNVDPVIITALDKKIDIHSGRVYVAMVETLFRRKTLLQQLREHIHILIVDECHIGNFHKLLDGWRRIIGFTATPFYDKKEDNLKNYYHNLFCGIDTNELVNAGYLLKPITYAPLSKLDKKKLKILNGEYDSKYTTNFLTEERVFSPAIDSIKLHGTGRMIIYNQSVSHSMHVTARLRAEGFAHVYHIDGTTPTPERQEILRRLRNEDDAIVCNCGVLTFGFDEPRVRTIVVNRLTKSLTLWLQMVGRGARPHPGKDSFKLLDLYGNCIDHGMWESVRDWNYLFSRQQEKRESLNVNLLKVCPKCDFVQNAQTRQCPECEHVFNLPEEVENRGEKSELGVIKPEMLDQIQESIKKKGHKPYAGVYELAKLVIKAGKKHKYSPAQMEQEMLSGMKIWCEKNNKRYNTWHADYALDALKIKSS